jgi:ribosomal-protein-alanine N-acetyltransferase
VTQAAERSEIPEVRTERLRLRGFIEPDLPVWNRALFADPDVTRYLPIDGPLSDEDLDRALVRGRAHWSNHGYGAWAAQEAASGTFAGHCGLRYLDDAGETEVYYALAKPFWGRGLATEAASAALAFGFDRAGLARIVAYAVPDNTASTHVMAKLGMGREEEVEIVGLRCVRYAIARPGDREGAIAPARLPRPT